MSVPYRWSKHPLENITWKLKEIKWFYQRGKRGYSDRDVWDFYTYLLRVFAGGLKELKENEMGYPCTCYTDNKDPEKCDCENKWDLLLDKMIAGFEAGINYDDSFDEEDMKKCEEALNTFKEYFFALWD